MVRRKEHPAVVLVVACSVFDLNEIAFHGDAPFDHECSEQEAQEGRRSAQVVASAQTGKD